ARRKAERKDRGVVILAVLLRHDALFALERRGVGVSEIRADPLPGMSPILGAPHVLRSHVEHVGVLRRQVDRKGPLKALTIVGWKAEVEVGPDIDLLALAGLSIENGEAAPL